MLDNPKKEFVTATAVPISDEASDAKPGRETESILSWERSRSVIIGTISVLVAGLLWEHAVRAEWINPSFVAAPSGIWNALVDVFSSGEIWQDLQVSGHELGVGLGLAVVVGVVVGIAFGWYRIVYEALNPFVTVLYATPRIALVPVLILTLGIGIESKIAIVFLSGVFELILNTSVGVKTVDRKMIDLARSYGAGDLRLFSTVAIPHSVPYILTGIRLAVGRGLVGVVVGELFASQHGVGHMLVQSAARFQPDRMFAALAIISSTGLILTFLVTKIERHFEAWRVS